MNHVDLFSGIGGFAYAAKQVWSSDYHNVCFCDNNPFCQQVIKKVFGKDSLIYGDIRTVTQKQIIADTPFARTRKNISGLRAGACGIDRREKTGGFTIDLLTGGFPCQPFSIAGNRKGKADNRFLWPEMLRIIKEIKPTWIIGENVAGILSMEQQQGKTDVESEVNCKGDSNTDSETDGLVWEIVNDIEQAGYFVQPFTIPACAVNAPHKRVRIWIVAYARCKYGTGSAHNGKTEGTAQQGSAPLSQRSVGHGGNGTSTNPQNPNGTRRNKRQGEEQPRRRDSRTGWETNWLEVATELCGMDDGLPVGLDRFKLTKTGHRVERLKALGNAIVPQVAMEIMRAIKESHL